MYEPTDKEVRHLEFIQGVINRMATNSFTLKALAGTITAAVLAYAGAAKNAQPLLVLAGIIPVGMFWYLDARYLQLEESFRALYDAVRKGQVQEPFDMNFKPHATKVRSRPKCWWSWSARNFHLTLFVVLIILAVVLNEANPLN